MISLFALTFIISFVTGMLSIPAIIKFCKEKGLYDQPDHRKVHKSAIPRLGGVAFIPALGVGCIAAIIAAIYMDIQIVKVSLWTMLFISGITAIYITGLIDDIVGLDALTKLVVQLAASSVLPIGGLYFYNLEGLFGIYEIPALVGIPLTILTVAFISNAINLIDGIDGLSGGLSLMMLAGFMYAFYSWELWAYVIIIIGLMGIITAFLYFNIWGTVEKGNKIFMGDTGSLSLGFLLAFLGLKLSIDIPTTPYHFQGNGILISFTLLIVPVFDVFRVSLLRLRNKRSPLRPDKNHIHHKLLRCGMTQHQALISILLLELMFIIVNYFADHVFPITTIVIIDISFYILFHFIANMVIRIKGNEPHVF